jgi:hypothetical protein
MKKMIAVLFLICLALPAFSLDKIRDDYQETNVSALHSSGLFTYGLHSNTFHLRYFFLRYNFTPELALLNHDLQFFVTLNGYKDTHIPETNYYYMINNINLYDYGIYYKFFNHFFLSLRGAGNYQPNYDTFLLLPSFFSFDNAGEFDSPPQYLQRFLTPAGIRVGFVSDNLEIGYSQGDFRHAIPMAARVRYTGEGYTFQALLMRVNSDPLTYDLKNFYLTFQPSAKGELRFGEWSLLGFAELNWVEGWKISVRLEEAVSFNEFTFALRQIIPNDLPALFEFSLTKSFYSLCSLGVFASTDGRVYIGTKIDF